MALIVVYPDVIIRRQLRIYLKDHAWLKYNILTCSYIYSPCSSHYHLNWFHSDVCSYVYTGAYKRCEAVLHSAYKLLVYNFTLFL